MPYFLFISVYLDRAWLGLRFLRACVILNLPDVLVYIRVINSSSAIRLAQLTSIFFTVVIKLILIKRSTTDIIYDTLL